MVPELVAPLAGWMDPRALVLVLLLVSIWSGASGNSHARTCSYARTSTSSTTRTWLETAATERVQRTAGGGRQPPRGPGPHSLQDPSPGGHSLGLHLGVAHGCPAVPPRRHRGAGPYNPS